MIRHVLMVAYYPHCAEWWPSSPFLVDCLFLLLHYLAVLKCSYIFFFWFVVTIFWNTASIENQHGIELFLGLKWCKSKLHLSASIWPQCNGPGPNDQKNDHILKVNICKKRKKEKDLTFKELVAFLIFPLPYYTDCNGSDEENLSICQK